MSDVLNATSRELIDLITLPEKVIMVKQEAFDAAKHAIRRHDTISNDLTYKLTSYGAGQSVIIEPKYTLEVTSSVQEVSPLDLPELLAMGLSIDVIHPTSKDRLTIGPAMDYKLTPVRGVNVSDYIVSILNHDLAVSRGFMPDVKKQYSGLHVVDVDELLMLIDPLWLAVTCIVEQYPNHIVDVKCDGLTLAVRIFCDVRTYLWVKSNINEDDTY